MLTSAKMTRFARAKGSKASNEKLPHQASSWNEMKQDLQKAQEEFKSKDKRKEFFQERQNNYNNFVKESEKPQEKKWAAFPKPNLKIIKKNKKTNPIDNVTEADVTDDMINEMCYSDPEVDTQLKSLTDQVDSQLKTDKKLKKITPKLKPKLKAQKLKTETGSKEVSTTVESKKINVKKVTNKKKALKIAPVKSGDRTTKPKLKAQKLKTETGSEDEAPEEVSTTVEPKKINVKKVTNKKKALKIAPVKSGDSVQKKPQPKKEKMEKPRRKEFKHETVMVNGKEEAIVFYQRFPVLESDKQRLEELRKALISKGLPSFEVNKAMRLARRQAEKFLAKRKKKKCFNCRGQGHLFSECPSLNTSDIVRNSSSGYCFKCGSVEHLSKDCKVAKDFKFAKCFICKEQGHISNQCPDNPKGIYPKGGACRLCGDVTHLAKDCSKSKEQKDDGMELNTIVEDNVEGVDYVPQAKKAKIVKKKVVKY